MPLVIFEGPEAAGKTTLIDALLERWPGETEYRHWGPRTSWLEYCQPLFDDIQTTKLDSTKLIVWSRSWLSRAVYNKLLNQGYSVPHCVLSELDKVVIRGDGHLFLVTAPVTVLLQRRLERLSQPDSKPDHPLDPDEELTEFYKQNKSRKWHMVSGVKDTDDTVREILDQIVRKSPESMMGRLEQSIAD